MTSAPNNADPVSAGSRYLPAALVLAVGIVVTVVGFLTVRDWAQSRLPSELGGWQAWGVLAVGLLFTGVLTAYALTLGGRGAWAEAIVAERTAELSEANEQLQSEMAQRARVQEALAESEQRYRSVVDNVAVGIAIISPDMEILSLNDQMRERFPGIDVSVRPICYRVFNDPPRDDVCPYCPTRETLRDGEVHEVVTETPAAGGIRNVRVVASPLRDSAGEVVAAVEMVEDITEQRRAEEALRDSEQRFRALTESTSDWVWEVDADAVYTYASPKVKDLLGYEPEEVVGKTPFDLMPPEEAARVGEEFGRLGQSQMPFAGLENTNRHRDGHLVVLETSGVPVIDDEGRLCGYRGIDRDVTQRKQAEEALRRSRREVSIRHRIARTFLTAPDEEMYGAVLDVVLGALESQHGVFGYVNGDGALVCPSMTRDIWEQCEVPDKHIVYPREEWGGIWGRALTEKRTLCSNDPLVVPAGHLPVRRALATPIAHRDELIGLLLVGNKQTDYEDTDEQLLAALGEYIAPVLQARLQRDRQETARKRAEESLRHERDLLHALMDNIPDTIYFKDSESRFRRINTAHAKVLGLDGPDEAVGKTDFDFFPAEQAQDAFDDERHIVETGEPLLNKVEDRRRPDKGERWVMSTKVPLTDEEGRVTGIVGVSRDITERMRAEEQLKQTAEELARSNAELEEFAYVASHDLQEPLRKVVAFGARLDATSGEALGERGRDYLHRMQNAAGRMRALINDLLTYSRVTTKGQPFVQVNLGEVAEGVLSDLEVLIEQTGAKMGMGELPTIDADPLQMRQLLQNLIGNALKFRREGEPLVVNVYGRVVDGEGTRAARGLRDAPVCEMVVQDNGIGFDERYRGRIFRVFQRLHGLSAYAGTGMGLAICRKIAERHGGSIAAHSAPGEGARFVVRLPVRQVIVGGAE
ncbi:MAG: PAS domain S-box protein [Armatimonadota bacterium]